MNPSDRQADPAGAAAREPSRHDPTVALWDEALLGAGFDGQPEQTVDAQPSRGGEPAIASAPAGSLQIARVRLDNGAVLLLPTVPAATSGAGAAGTDRGAVSLLAKVLTNSSIGRKAIKVFTTKAVNGTVAYWERGHRPSLARLFRTVDAEAAGAPLSPTDWERLGRGRSLLFLHGTLGQAHTSFAGLDRHLLDELANRYEGRVWAFDHHTLSDSPQQNAHDLLQLIAENTSEPLEVDIIGYDRGGLVARELAHRGDDRRLRAGTLVLVGTPNLGTPLAQPEHMIAYANRLANLATLAPDPIADAAGAIVTVLTHVFSSALDSLPGLAALQPPNSTAPTAPTANTALDALNAATTFTGVRYHLIGADYRPDQSTSLGRVFVDWAVDNVFHDVANDLLVPTASALFDLGTAGAPDGSAVERLLVHGASHGGYWSPLPVRAAIRAALLDAPIVAGGGAATEPPAVDDVQAPSLREFGTQPVSSSVTAGAAPPWSATRTVRAPLTVGVMHGSLEHVDQAVIVGHVQGTPMTGAEQRLDECFDGRLSRRRMLRRYPGLLREVALVPNATGATPPRAVIVGLGVTGSLTATRLVDTMIAGMLDLAMAEVDAGIGDITERSGARSAKPVFPRPIEVASVLVGSSAAAGLTTESSVRALVAAAVAAEARLAETPVVMPDGSQRSAADLVHINSLQIIERYADRVDIIASVLARMRDEHSTADADVQPIVYVPQPVLKEGRSPGSAPIDNDETWRRLEVHIASSADGDSMLQFTSLGRLARAEQITKRFNPNVVDPLLQGSIDHTDDMQIAGSLFELLLPTELKGELGNGENLHLLVDETSAYIPWELLAPRAKGYQAQLPIALRSGALRQFTEASRLRTRPSMAAGNTALVIGNPPPPPGFPSLPGAAGEANRAASILEQQGFETTALIWDAQGRPQVPAAGAGGGVDVVQRLLNGDWRIVHIAAHGQLTDSPNTSGVVLSDNVFLTADVFESLSVVPDLVFLNACHLSGISRSLTGMNRVAASVARALIQIGVRAVVAAGWAVNDTAASLFAEELYRAMLAEGADFGTAVTRARRLIHDEVPQSMTWGAYQCYGDPGFRLSNKRSRVSDGPVYTENELRRRARHIISAAGDQGRTLGDDEDDGGETLHDRLVERLAVLNPATPPPGALQPDNLSSAALADLAEAYGELGDFTTAIDLYTRAVQHERADAPIRALEQLGNLQIREAQRLVAEGNSANPSREATRLLNDSLAWLTRALDLSETGERLAMLGSYYKKRAAVTPARVGTYLLKSIDYYRHAYLKRPNDYHLLLWTQLCCVAEVRGDTIPTEYDSDPAAVRARLDEWLRTPPRTEGFWGRATQGDRALTKALADGTYDLKPALSAYRKAFALRSSDRERAGVCDHLADLARLLPEGNARTLLDEAHTALVAWTPRR